MSDPAPINGLAAAAARADAERAQAAWRQIRAASDIQFAPPPPPPVSSTPEWVEVLLRWLQKLLEPLGRLFGLSWPVLEKVLLGLAGLVALGLLALAGRHLWARWQARQPRAPADWAPEAEEATALLADADALAAAGDYAGAVHLLLVRSVGQIVAARPGALTPATTAREIAVLDWLAPRARAAFATLADRVEASRFALLALALPDWQAARGAYADFALAPLAAGGQVAL